MDVRVSVIVSSYNQPNTLRLSLEGVLHQDRADYEVVVADDGSDDGTRALVEAYSGAAVNPIRFVTQEDLGFRKARALNNGIRAARGEYLLFLDGDCIPRSDWITRHLAVLEPRRWAFSAAGYVLLDLETTRSLTVDSVRDGSFERVVTPAQRRRNVEIHWRELFYAAVRRRRKPKIRGGNWAVERTALEAVNGFDENFEGFGKEDSDIRNRLQAAGFRGRSLWHRNWVVHCHHDLDPRRTDPSALRRPPDRTYYEKNAGAPRCARGLADER